MEKYTLTNWTLRGYYPHFTNCMTEEMLAENTIIDEIPATVPGSVYKDLLDAGIIQNPYYGLNSLACEWVENRWWAYKTRFSASVFKHGNSRKYLCFDGVDNLVNIVLNGKKIARFEGANHPYEIDITDLCEKNNTLEVVFEKQCMDNGQFARTCDIATQKPRYYYKWDFGIRLVNIGIYRSVYLKEYTTARIDNCCIRDEWSDDNTKLKIALKTKAFSDFNGKCKIVVCDEDKTVYETVRNQAFNIGENEINYTEELGKVERWYPNGHGAPKVYTVCVSIYDGEEKIDEYSTIYGFRSIRAIPNEGAPTDYKHFLFEVNGKPIYVKGFNFVPIDLMNGEHLKDKVDKLIGKVQECGANLLRVWGGGYIESEEFYESCSRRGVMVWQDFLQSSSSEDSRPNLDSQYLEKLKETSSIAIKARRNYPCLAVWCGGNELRSQSDTTIPSLGDDANLQMLKELVAELDPQRIFYPVTPFGGNLILDFEKGTNQNVHGNYKYYDGDYDLYHNQHYNRSNSLFNGELGVEGLSDLSTLESILPQKDIAITDGLSNKVWLHLGNWWTPLSLCEKFFGKLKSLEDYVYASQYIQAEGIRYAIECNRRRAFYNSGSIIWQLNEPNPCVCNTSIVEYDLKPKQAFYALQKCFQKVLGCVRYEKLIYEKGEKINLRFYFVNETDEKRTLRIRVIADERHLLFDHETLCKSTNGRAEELFEISYDNEFTYGIKIELISGEYENSVLLLSKGDRGHCDLDYVKRQNLWKKEN